MSRLDFCQYELVDDCHDWKNDNCDECNIFKAYCEGARRANNSIVRCKDCRYQIKEKGIMWCSHEDGVCGDAPDNFYCAYGEKEDE